MAAINDVTGDSIQSRMSNKNFSDNWDRIFGQKNKAQEEVKEVEKEEQALQEPK